MKLISYLYLFGSVWGVNSLKNRPVKKVIAVLQDMTRQLEAEQRTDEDVYNKVKCWCENNDKEMSQSVKDAVAKIAQLTAQIEELVGTISRLDTEIENLGAEIGEKTTSLAEATTIREKELANFNQEEKDMIQSISALKSAIQVLSKHNTKQALMSISNMVRHEVLDKNKDKLAGVLTPAQRKFLHSVLVQKDYTGAAPIGEGSYSSASGQIFGILKQMLDTFEQEMTDEQKTEMERQKAFKALKLSLEQQVKAATDSKEAKTNERAKATESLQIAKDDKADTEATLSADEKFLINLKETCTNTDTQWEERQKTRAEELQAIAEAISILGSDNADNVFGNTYNKQTRRVATAPNAAPAPAGPAEAAAPPAPPAPTTGPAATFGPSPYPPSPYPATAPPPPVFAQVGSFRAGSVRDRVYAVLNNIPKNSPNKAQFSALALSVKLDSFTKVKAAIDTMISDLQVQQSDEVKERDWCNDSLNENDKNNIKENNNKEQLEAEIDFQNSEISRLVEELDGHAKNINELMTEMKKAGENREKENIEFQTMVNDQNASLQLLRQATAVLARVYQTDEQKAKATGGATLAQVRTHQTPQPEGFNTYKKQAGGGVIGMLEKIIAQTEVMKKEAITAEQTAQKDYENFIKQSNESKDAESKAVINKTEQKSMLESAQEVSQNNLDASNSELERLAREKADFHLRCDFLINNFDARQEARGQEIEALQTAKAILSGSQFGAEAAAQT